MNAQSSAMPGSLPSSEATPRSFSEFQILLWLIRREFWENRFLYVAPLAVAAVALAGFIGAAIVGIWKAPLRLDPTQSRGMVAMPYDMAAGLLMFTSIMVGIFYCLDALHGERRDRSILFWKSLPVSDLATVLAKASIPIIILPMLCFLVVVATQWLMLMVSTVVVFASGQSVAPLWSTLGLFRMWLLLLYHFITAHGIWPAPVYCWLLLVSGFPRRATFLWAGLPILAIAGVEGIVFRSYHFALLVGGRLIGQNAPIAHTPADVFPTGPMTHITPGAFLGSPALWLGLGISAIFLFAAVRLRRYRGAI